MKVTFYGTRGSIPVADPVIFSMAETHRASW